MSEKIKWLLGFFVPALCVVSFLIIAALYTQLSPEYRLVILMPVVYAAAFMLFFQQIFNTEYKITVSLYFLMQALRMVVMPAAIALAGEESAGAYVVASASIKMACVLMLLEFLIVTLFVAIRSQKRIFGIRAQKPVLSGSGLVYFVMGLLGVVLFVYFKSQGTSLFYFIALPVGEGERIGDITETSLVLARQIVTLAIRFIFLMILDYCQRKTGVKNSRRYSNLAVFAAIMMVCIIVGERRSAQIYTAFLVSYLLSLVFREKSTKSILLVCGVALAIFAAMSVYKQFAGFLYDSYEEAFEKASMDINEFASMLQSYFAGPKNIALAIDYGSAENPGIKQVLFDFARSTVPISFLMKGSGSLTSVLMNQYIYKGLQDTGHVLAGTGYGYVFGSVLLFFWPVLLNVMIAFFAEKQMRRAKSFEWISIWLTVLLRFGLNISANPPALISAATIHLFTAGLVAFGATCVKRVFGYENPGYLIRSGRV